MIRIAVDQTLATGLWAALGVGLGALIGNQVGAVWGFTAGLIPFIRTGQLRALVITHGIVNGFLLSFPSCQRVVVLSPAHDRQIVVRNHTERGAMALQLAADQQRHVVHDIGQGERRVGRMLVACLPDDAAFAVR